MKLALLSVSAILLGACATTPLPDAALSEDSTNPQRAASQHITKPEVVDKVISDFVASGDVAGYSVVVYQNDEEVYYGEAGFADLESQKPIQRDTIHSIYSMTKPIVSVGLMTLYEQDLFELDDPISKHIPEFGNMVVYAGEGEDGEPIFVPAEKTITVLDMLRHTAGLPESFWGGPDTGSEIFGSQKEIGLENTLSEMAEAGGSLPLLFQPGTQWRYSWAVDMQSLMIERLSGKPVEEYLREVLFDPLGMKDTTYYVPEGEQHRLATIYTMNEEGVLEKNIDQFTYDLHRKPHAMKPGSLGMVSTIDDYSQFALMLLNGGELNGVRVLKPQTVSLMSDDHLPSGLVDTSFLGKRGFGLGFTVRLLPPESDSDNFGYVGEFRWGGAAGTNFWVDPTNDLAVVIMTQRLPYDGKLHKQIRDAVYNVMDRFDAVE
ncbi:serine hydrolase domain-containing protein [Hirschia litorea]|uniref:Serine hydrolase domain-containing protein n=1 Tax=Hirschia litorea TaxID=1199156 RepID=A0ABW2IPF9_9PROT